nr:pentatricopeptide repeat-containing protein, putative [Ipomoea batatas]
MKTSKIGHGKSNIATLTLLLVFTIVAILYLCSWAPYSPVSPARDNLDAALRKASMASNTVIITVINKAYVEPVNEDNPSMLDLFLEGFWEGEGTRGLVDHLLVVAMDHTAYERCVFRRLHCYGLNTDGAGGVDFSGEKIFMSKDFIDMMWRRTLFLLDVLKRGYNFIFTDTDIIWLRNPFTRLSSNSTEDLQISTDIFTGDPWSTSNPINTGFYYVRSNKKTITLFQSWYDMRKNYPAKMKEQDILALMKRAGVFKEMGLVVSGFCTDTKDAAAVATVHANCCRSVNAKVVDLRNVLSDWKAYRESRNDGAHTQNFQWTEPVICKNSWDRSNNHTSG